MSQFRQLLSELLFKRFRTSSAEHKSDAEAEEATTSKASEAPAHRAEAIEATTETSTASQNENKDDPRRRQVVDLENDDKNANEPIKTKRTLKRANTEAVTGCGGESRQFMTKSSNNKDFISKDEARRRMMSWRKTTSLRYSSTTNPYHSVNTKK